MPFTQDDWLKLHKDSWTRALDSQTKANQLHDIIFECGERREKIHWNGLALLACLSPVFKEVALANAALDQRVTVVLPGHEADLVKKVLLLLATGSVTVEADEMEPMFGLQREFGVRKIAMTNKSYK